MAVCNMVRSHFESLLTVELNTSYKILENVNLIDSHIKITENGKSPDVRPLCFRCHFIET